MTLTLGVVLLALGGSALAVGGAAFALSAYRVAAAATRSADGTIVGHDRVEGDESVFYYPRVAFTADGTEWVVRGQIGHHRPHPRVGAFRRVYFPPGKPEAASMSRFEGVWAALGLVLFGLLMATVSVKTWLDD
jgi:hypothetical protein